MVTELELSAVADQDAGYCALEGILPTAVLQDVASVPLIYQCT